MVQRRKPEETSEPLPPPATTLEGREDQLVAAAYDLVERRIRDGTASAQETVHFLRIGSVNAKLQNEKILKENQVLSARVKESESRRSQEDLLEKAMKMFTVYNGTTPFDPEEPRYDPDLF